MWFTCLVAILLDGGFVKKALRKRCGGFPTVTNVTDLCEEIMARRELAGHFLFRVFFYDADPYTRKKTAPDGAPIDFAETQAARRNAQLLQSLELQPHFAVRRGILTFHGWRLKRKTLKRLTAGKPTEVRLQDIEPDLKQKGVDMRVGLDIANLALKRIVSAVVLVTGDSDMVPAMKYARREGLRVYLNTLGQRWVRPELKAHADVLL